MSFEDFYWWCTRLSGLVYTISLKSCWTEGMAMVSTVRARVCVCWQLRCTDVDNAPGFCSKLDFMTSSRWRVT